MPAISIIIGAYNAQNFIEECLDSIQEQTYFKANPDYEILVGVDACIATLLVLRSIQHKYKNLRVFYGPVNQGVYITFNSLLAKATGEHVLFFGADDIMFPDMVEKCFQKGAPLVVRHHGIQFLQRSVFDRTGGFMPWRVAADSEHLSRIRRFHPNVPTCEYLYTYRKHPGQLTAKADTGFGSEIRNKHLHAIQSGNIPDKIQPQLHKSFIEVLDTTPDEKLFGRRIVAAGVASFPARAQSLHDTIDSIIPHVDVVFVYLNEYPFVPDYLYQPKIVVMQSQKMFGDLGDVGKFVGLRLFNGIYLTIDDDLVYRKDYVSTMLRALKQHNNNIVSLHGRVFRSLPCISYYKCDSKFISCLRPNKSNVRANIPGSGVMAFATEFFKPDLADFRTINMSDIWIGMLAQNLTVPIMIVAHDGHLVAESKNYNRDMSIWALCHSDDSVQTEIVNNFNWNLIQ